MTLTAEQVAALKQGEPVIVALPELGAECILMRKDIYERDKAQLSIDSEFDPVEAFSLVNDVMAADDANDPWLESYQTP